MEKKNRFVANQVEDLRLSVITLVTSQNNGIFDEIEREFNQSITYQLLKDSKTNFYLLDSSQLLELWQKEQIIKIELGSFFKASNNKLIISMQEIIKKEILESALKDNLTAEDAYHGYLKKRNRFKKR